MRYPAIERGILSCVLPRTTYLRELKVKKISANSQNRQFLATPLPKTAAPKPSSALYCRGQN